MKNNSPFTCKSKIQFIDCDSLNNGISIDRKVLPKQVRVYLTQGMKCPVHTIITPKCTQSFSFLGYTATVIKLFYKGTWDRCLMELNTRFFWRGGKQGQEYVFFSDNMVKVYPQCMHAADVATIRCSEVTDWSCGGPSVAVGCCQQSQEIPRAGCGWSGGSWMCLIVSLNFLWKGPWRSSLCTLSADSWLVFSSLVPSFSHCQFDRDLLPAVRLWCCASNRLRKEEPALVLPLGWQTQVLKLAPIFDSRTTWSSRWDCSRVQSLH